MNIGFENINRSISPQAPGVGGDVDPLRAPASEKAKGGWTAREAGAAELTRVAGEEAIDERALARDDDLGKLMAKAFDPSTAAAALPPLGIAGS